ncbi:hypothetical protein ACIPSA_50110 [Streptomyces sp. NPDC086549]|uniref:hypothetical protein n=1 Tax=Streptomyces sp. NPDC086549 TaxID=3365752 RepID=UPI0037F83F9D
MFGLTVSALCTAGLAFISASADLWVWRSIGLLFAVYAGFKTLMFGVWMVSPPTLHLTDVGLRLGGWGMYLGGWGRPKYCAWTQVSRIEVRTSGTGNPIVFVGLDPTCPPPGLRAADRLRRGHDIRLGIVYTGKAYGHTVQDLAQLLNAWRQRASPSARA